MILDVINECINVCIKNDLVDCVYLDKQFEKDDKYLNIYFIFNITYDNSKFIKLIEKSCSLVYKNVTDSIVEVITDFGFRLNLISVSNIYDFKNLVILYNPQKKEVCKEFTSENEKKMIEVILSYTTNMYNFHISKNVHNALSYLHNALNESLKFMIINITKNPFETLVEYVNEKDFKKYLKIEKLLKVDSISECSLLLAWFMDELINSLPISVAYNINIDYYLHVKNLIIKEGKR